MRIETYLKIGQIVGVLFMAAGVAACQMDKIESTPTFFMVGGLLYAVCRLAGWLRAK